MYISSICFIFILNLIHPFNCEKIESFIESEKLTSGIYCKYSVLSVQESRRRFNVTGELISSGILSGFILCHGPLLNESICIGPKYTLLLIPVYKKEFKVFRLEHPFYEYIETDTFIPIINDKISELIENEHFGLLEFIYVILLYVVVVTLSFLRIFFFSTLHHLSAHPIYSIIIILANIWIFMFSNNKKSTESQESIDLNSQNLKN